ncbi:MAG: hypothetical protein P8Y78_09645 [Acidihalobacter sp.]
MRIAMWSGPRNLSTALMYAFAARGDCAVWDEPFYAAYLQATGIDHPMRGEIIAAGETDPMKVAAVCAGEVPDGLNLFYQKHMTLHMIPGFPRDFMRACENVFLIRHPARVVASYARKREGPMLEDIGFVQQAELFDEVADWLGRAPLVVDSADIRAEPRETLKKLCGALGVPFTDKMLSWPAGGHPDDGVWASHWYGAVHRSTGFAEPEGALPELSGEYASLVDSALPYYEKLRGYCL